MTGTRATFLPRAEHQRPRTAVLLGHVTPEELLIVFAEGWALPKPDGFLGYFLPKIAANAIFVQPLFPPAVAHQQIAQTFRRLFALMPDMTASPVSSAVAQRTVFIESVCTATLADRRVEFQVCDRFEIKDSLVTKRHSYSDPLPLLATALRPECLRVLKGGGDRAGPYGRVQARPGDGGGHRLRSRQDVMRACHPSAVVTATLS